MWLLTRLFDAGDQPTPKFAFQGTVNWMRGLAIVCVNEGFSLDNLNHLYRSVNRRPEDVKADTLAFECLVMAMHNVSSLELLKKLSNPYGIIRSSIVAWYYAIYYACKAMLAAATGADPQTHSKTGKLWQTEFVNRELVQSPFELSIQDLTPNNIKIRIDAIRAGNNHNLDTKPNNLDMAWGAIYSYLSGTAEYEKDKYEEQVRNSSEFKKAGFSNGSDYSETLKQSIEDLREVAGAFVLMAAYYSSKRVAKDSWKDFCKDIRKNARFELPLDLDKI